MKNSAELKRDVKDTIKWEPLLNAAEICVTVTDGEVTLSSLVDNYTKKSEAKDTAKNVVGVKAVVEKIEVKFNSTDGKKNDNEIVDEIVSAFKWSWCIPHDKVKVKV